MFIQELENRIFSISSTEEFHNLAIEIFHYQMENLPIYRKYAEILNRTDPKSLEEIPFLPISFFKDHQIITSGLEPETVFFSSGTTGSNRSAHYVASTNLYKTSFLQTYQKYIGNVEDQVILALLPNYLEQGHSSLVYMVKELIQKTGSTLSGFVLNDFQLIAQRYLEAQKLNKSVVIFGVSYALLDLAEMKIDLSNATFIETGGMKGRRKEITKENLHRIICDGTGASYVRSEYGMTELLSQAYSDKDGLFKTPNWMKILIRDVNDPLSYVIDGKSGGINVVDLANLYSCSFIATQDLGIVQGESFRILGRFDQSDIRGCNLMVE